VRTFLRCTNSLAELFCYQTFRNIHRTGIYQNESTPADIKAIAQKMIRPIFSIVSMLAFAALLIGLLTPNMM
jgi:hypothetical protein